MGLIFPLLGALGRLRKGEKNLQLLGGVRESLCLSGDECKIK
jgi:hypothetical protein